jgi:hypothetical protein
MLQRPGSGQGWPIGGPPGLESIVLLARDEPLPEGFDLKGQLPKLAAIPLPETYRRRGPKDPVPRSLSDVDDGNRQRILKDHFGPHFPIIQIQSFANLGEPTESTGDTP